MFRNLDVLDEANRRGVERVLHFTTINGVVGALGSGALMSRDRAEDDPYLAYIFKPNFKDRIDTAWLDYINLSIQRINTWMLSVAKYHGKADNKRWVIMSFKPVVLTHPGVIFTTTNNIYASCKRGEGVSGYSEMYAQKIWGKRDALPVTRDAESHSSCPTDRQAEVLYPGELSCQHLVKIYVEHEKTQDTIVGALGVLGVEVPIQFAPEVFK